jgi:hypothetical protein
MLEPITKPTPSAADYLEAYRSDIEEVYQDSVQQGARHPVIVLFDTRAEFVRPTVIWHAPGSAKTKLLEFLDNGVYPVVITADERRQVHWLYDFDLPIPMPDIPKVDRGSFPVAISAPEGDWGVSLPKPREAS